MRLIKSPRYTGGDLMFLLRQQNIMEHNIISGNF